MDAEKTPVWRANKSKKEEIQMMKKRKMFEVYKEVTSAGGGASYVASEIQ